MSEDTVTLIAAIAFSIIGIGTFLHYFMTVGFWPQTTGRVTGNEAQRRTQYGVDYAYFPRIEFIAADGKTYQVKGDVGLNEEWPVGEVVTLRYRPANPNHVSIAKNWQRFVFSAAFIGFAAACWFAVLR